GNFEVVVRIAGNLHLFWHDNSNVTSGWNEGGVIARNVSGPGAIIQSNFMNGGHGTFEVVVQVGNDLRHFWHDNSDSNLPWQPQGEGDLVTSDVTGPGAIIQSDFTSFQRAHGNFEVVVPKLN